MMKCSMTNYSSRRENTKKLTNVWRPVSITSTTTLSSNGFADMNLMLMMKFL